MIIVIVLVSNITIASIDFLQEKIYAYFVAGIVMIMSGVINMTIVTDMVTNH